MSKRESKFGYCPELEKEHKSDKDYFFGGKTKLKGSILVKDGQWDNYLPRIEIQKKAFDSYACVSFSNNNVIETMHKRRYGEETNRSDRFTAKMSGTVPFKGNSLKAVADSQRLNGTVLEELWPFTDSMKVEEYYKTIPQDIKNAGLQWEVATEYGYEWISRRNRIEEMKKAIMFSPLQTAVDSYTNKTKNFEQFDHAVMIFGYVDNKHWKVFDSYRNRFVEYDWDYPFYGPMRVHYKKVLNIIFEDMKMRLIRDKESGNIFLLDSDEKRHHIEAPTDFKEFIGEKAWNDKDWEDMEAEQIKVYEEGMSISAKKTGMAEALMKLFKSFGRKK